MGGKKRRYGSLFKNNNQREEQRQREQREMGTGQFFGGGKYFQIFSN